MPAPQDDITLVDATNTAYISPWEEINKITVTQTPSPPSPSCIDSTCTDVAPHIHSSENSTYSYSAFLPLIERFRQFTEWLSVAYFSNCKHVNNSMPAIDTRRRARRDAAWMFWRPALGPLGKCVLPTITLQILAICCPATIDVDRASQPWMGILGTLLALLGITTLCFERDVMSEVLLLLAPYLLYLAFCLALGVWAWYQQVLRAPRPTVVWNFRTLTIPRKILLAIEYPKRLLITYPLQEMVLARGVGHMTPRWTSQFDGTVTVPYASLLLGYLTPAVEPTSLNTGIAEHSSAAPSLTTELPQALSQIEVDTASEQVPRDRALHRRIRAANEVKAEKQAMADKRQRRADTISRFAVEVGCSEFDARKCLADYRWDYGAALAWCTKLEEKKMKWGKEQGR